MNSFSEQLLAAARALFPHTETGRIYLNHAATSPFSRRIVNATKQYIEERSSGSIETYLNDIPVQAACREAVRRLINAESPERIALVGNTSDGLNIVSSGIAWKTGDRILLNDLEFPANIHPYYHLRSKGVEIDILKGDQGRITPEMIERSIHPRTRLVALSAVQYLTGHRADLEMIGSICRSKGVRFVVDGIQAVGAVRIDVQSAKIDAMSSGSQKWQMSPQGTGFLYVTESFQHELQQAYVGWLGVEDPWQFQNFDQPLAPTAKRYEGGSLNAMGIIGMKEALETLLEFGPDRIEGQILSLTRRIIDRVRAIDGFELISPDADCDRAGIVTVRWHQPRDLTPVFLDLQKQRIDISLRMNALRFSPHFYNSPKEIDRAVDALRLALSHA